MAAYDYASASGYARARSTWVDYPNVTTPVLASHLNRLDQAVADIKSVAPNVKDYLATGDGVADDTAAVVAAEAAGVGNVVFAPKGTYKTTLAATQLTGKFSGAGQIQDSGNHKRAPMFSAIRSAPSSLGNWDSVTSAFDGDLSKVQIAMEHRVTGAATLGQPTVAYEQDPEVSPIALYLYNESGFNNGTIASAGRTGLSAITASVYHTGQGDAGGIHISTFVTGQKPGYTHFGANAAGVLYNGQVLAGADAVYLNPVEINTADHGFDVAAVGHVINMARTNNTGAAGTLWNGIRLQTSGSKAVDVGFMAYGGGSGDNYLVGLDLSNAGLATTGTWINAAITLKGNQRIYLNASGTDAAAGMYRRPDSTGDTYIQYSTGSTALQMIVGNTNAMQFSAGGNISVVDLIIADAHNIQFNTTTGGKIGTATTQKIGFWNATPIVQPSTTGTATGFTAGAGTTVTHLSTFTGNTGSTAYTIGDVVNALKKIGLMAA